MRIKKGDRVKIVENHKNFAKTFVTTKSVNRRTLEKRKVFSASCSAKTNRAGGRKFARLSW